MAGDESGDSPARQEVKAGGDAYVAGRDLHVHLTLPAEFDDQDAAALSLNQATPAAECDPLTLGVHPAIQIDDGNDHEAVLPTYVPRKHDLQLEKVVRRAVAGRSQIAVLLGGPSAGKTRACWEAIRRLPSEWHLWHPYYPTRPRAAARALADLRPHTVVWLNDAQHYLLTSDPELSERVAAGLRSLLFSVSRAPVLILLTLWPEDWAAITERPVPGRPDPYYQARELLAGADLAVPDAFTRIDLEALSQKAPGDPRLQVALKYADAGHVTQYLAGVPVLLERYRNAPAVARAVIDCAIDALRLGYRSPITRTFIEHAAPGYLTDPEWYTAGEDWLESALRYTGELCHGTLGPLTRIRIRPGEREISPLPHYRLADYLEQAGQAARRGIFPSGSLWNAIAGTVEDTSELRSIARQAERRGRYRRAAQLYRNAAQRGDAQAVRSLAWLLIRAGDWDGAHSMAQRAAELGDAWPLADLEEIRQAHDPATYDKTEPPLVYLERPATRRMGNLARRREAAGDPVGAETIAVFAADRGDPHPLNQLIESRYLAGDKQGADAAAILGDIHGHNSKRYLTILHVDAQKKTGRIELTDEIMDLMTADDRRLSLRQRALLVDRVRDRSYAESEAAKAIEDGESQTLLYLAEARGVNGDVDGAEEFCVLAANCGNPKALRVMAALREHASDPVGAERIRRFGLNDDGSPAEMLE